MRLAIVHYHLRRGGVTRVIAAALEAMGEQARDVIVISSTAPEEEMACPCIVVPELDYCQTPSKEAVDALYRALIKATSQAFDGPPDLWHIHNHNLGKNVNFPPVLKRLLDQGHRALLQIHDFAEDGRPDNFLAQKQPYADGLFRDYDGNLYPVAPQVAYAVLNGRDRAILQDAGIPPEQIHWLPNAVTVPPLECDAQTEPSDKPLILYPTRAIRRKNLGELLLLALLCPEARFGTTLAPKNPQWFDIYEGWIRLADELGLGVEFGMGERPGVRFSELVARSTAMITTSVGEGFGLAYLEPWLFGKPLCGRDLPEVTSDFQENGISLPDLYGQFPVPCSAFDQEALRDRFLGSLQTVYASYGKSIHADELKSAWQSSTRDGQIDFGKLDETAQAEVIRNAATDPGLVKSPLPGLPDALDRGVLQQNVAKIQSTYGLDHYGSMLTSIYDSILRAKARRPEGLPANRILDSFLDPSRFSLLRT